MFPLQLIGSWISSQANIYCVLPLAINGAYECSELFDTKCWLEPSPDLRSVKVVGNHLVAKTWYYHVFLKGIKKYKFQNYIDTT